MQCVVSNRWSGVKIKMPSVVDRIRFLLLLLRPLACARGPIDETTERLLVYFLHFSRVRTFDVEL